ncbi:MAG: response regulator [Magnetococcales bacterium]|nr:response regulator [Magnetococcales bacterium]
MNRYQSQWFLLIGAILLMFAVVLVLFEQQYQQLHRQERERLAAQAQVIDHNLVRQLASVYEVLRYLRVEVPRWQQLSDWQNELQNHLQLLSLAMPGVRTLIFFDPNGNAISSNRREIIGKNFAYREYFQRTKQLNNPDILTLSSPFTTVSGIWSLNLSLPLQDDNKAFVGMLSASLDSSYFSTLLLSVLYAPDMLSTIIHEEGTLYLTEPGKKELSGRPMRQPGTFLTQHLANGQQQSVFSGFSTSLQQERLAIFRTIQDDSLPLDRALIVVTSRLLSALEKPLYQQFFLQIGLLLLTSLLLCLGLLFYQRRQQAIEKERLANEQRLRQERDFVRQMINALPGMFYLIDLSGRFRLWNKALEEATGFSSQEVELASALEFFQGDEQSLIAERIQVVFQQGFATAEASVVHRNGSATPYYFVGHRVEAEGELLLIGMGLDISERKRMEVALQQAKMAAEAANQAKSEFLAAMSHEIRTPMQVVIGMGDMLLEAGLHAQEQAYVRKQQSAGNALLELINQILDLAKIESGHMQLQEQAVDLPALLQELILLLQDVAKGKALQLNLQVDPQLPIWLLADPLRLRQVLFNLLSNAIKFTEQGSIRLTAVKEDEERLLLTVEDTGIGIEAAHWEQIFDRFSQADSSITRRYGGTGLGLAIARQLVQLMGGSITMHSVMGAGSTFRIFLPLRPTTAPLTPVIPLPHLAERSSPALTILLAEDTEDNQLLIQAFLKHTPHRLLFAVNGQEAVRLVQEQTIDLVLMDVQMPIMDGYTATRLIRQWEAEQQRSALPIIACTAHAFEGEAERSRQAGCNQHLSKPIKKRQLLEVIAQHAQQITAESIP